MNPAERALTRCPRGGRLREAVARVCVVAVLALSSLPALSQPVVSAEEVQAAYIHKFLSYVDWPSNTLGSPAAPLVVGVAGNSRMFELLLGVAAGRPAQGRAVEVRRVSNPEESAGVHLVFVGKDAWKELPGWAAWSKEHPMVITTDAPQGIEHGAVLAFIRSGERVRFEASVAAAEKSRVKLSARLLGVAERVVGAGQ